MRIWRSTIGDPWADIAKAEELERRDRPAVFLPRRRRRASTAGCSATPARWCAAPPSAPKPSDERLREYRDTALPRIEQQLGANTPIYPELEQLTLSFSLERMREWLGPDDPSVRQLLGKESPDAAREAPDLRARSSRIRRRAWRCGRAARRRWTRADDPMIELAKLVDERSRAVRKKYEDEIEAVARTASEKVAKARFAALGTSVYPGRHLHAAPELRLGAGLE